MRTITKKNPIHCFLILLALWTALYKQSLDVLILAGSSSVYGQTPTISSLPSRSDSLHDLFFFIWVSPPSTLTWRVLRAIDAVFYHHPHASVKFYSRFIPQNGTVLDRFQAKGYDLTVHDYSFLDVASQSPSVTKEQAVALRYRWPALSQLPDALWYEADFMRLLLMEKHGGVYLDTDMHLIRPLSATLNNVLAFEDSNNTKLNGAALIFEKSNPFIQMTLRKGIAKILERKMKREDHPWGAYCPTLLTETYRKLHSNHTTPSSWVATIDYEVFYPYHWRDVHKCFFDNFTDSNLIDPNRTLAVHLNTHLTQEQSPEIKSVCNWILNDHCVVCG